MFSYVCILVYSTYSYSYLLLKYLIYFYKYLYLPRTKLQHMEPSNISNHNRMNNIYLFLFAFYKDTNASNGCYFKSVVLGLSVK